MALWQQRSQKPEAWNQALGAVGKEIAKKYAARQDPQLAENQRAMKVSRDQMATTQKVDRNERWSGMNEQEFQHEWNRLVQG